MTEILLIILYTLILAIVIYRWRVFSLSGIKKWYVVVAFVIKVMAGIALGLLYTHHYTDRSKADTYKFFDDSGVMMDALSINSEHFFKLLTGTGLDDPELEPYTFKMNTWLTEDFYITSNRMMIRLNVMFRFLTPPGEHYYLHVVMFNFLSLLGLIFLCKTFFVKQLRFHRVIFISLILFPSILFWGSGLLKDGIIIFATGSMMYSFSRMLNGDSHKFLSGFVFIVSAVFLALIKIYILFAMLPALVAWAWYIMMPNKVVMKFLLVHLMFVLIAIGVHIVSEKFDLIHYLTLKQREFFHVVQVEKPNHVLAIRPIENSMFNIIREAVPAFFRTFLRPHILESREPLILLSALENLLLLLFALFAVFVAKKASWQTNPLFYFSLAFFIIIFMLIGLIVPVTGAIVRYKIIALPFLVYMLFSMLEVTRAEKILKRFNA